MCIYIVFARVAPQAICCFCCERQWWLFRSAFTARFLQQLNLHLRGSSTSPMVVGFSMDPY